MSGTVTNATGQPTAGMVLIEAMPDMRHLSNVGDQFNMIQVIAKQTASDGSFGITSAEIDQSPGFAQLQQAAAPNGGWVSFTIGGALPGATGGVSQSLKLNPDGSWSADSAHRTTGLSIAASVTVPQSEYKSIAARAAVDPSVTGAQDANVRVGETHRWYDSRAHFGYKVQADSDLDIGYQVGGQGWGFGGSAHIANGHGGGASGPEYSVYGVHYSAPFRYTRYHNISYLGGCSQPGNHIRPTFWEFGVNRVGPWQQTRDGECGLFNKHTTFPGGWTFDKNFHKGFHYSYDVSAFGVHLGGSSGYTTTVRYWYYVKYKTWICSEAGDVYPMNASILAVGPRV